MQGHPTTSEIERLQKGDVVRVQDAGRVTIDSASLHAFSGTDSFGRPVSFETVHVQAILATAAPREVAREFSPDAIGDAVEVVIGGGDLPDDVELLGPGGPDLHP